MSTIKVGTISNSSGSASTSADNIINGSAKAWVNFNGTGTVAIRQGYNVSSITDNGTGNYTINFTNALPDANYSITGTAGAGSTGTSTLWGSYGTPTTTTAQVGTGLSTTGANTDYAYVSVVIFR